VGFLAGRACVGCRSHSDLCREQFIKWVKTSARGKEVVKNDEQAKNPHMRYSKSETELGDYQKKSKGKIRG